MRCGVSLEDNLTMFAGPDRAAHLIEVGTVEAEDGAVVIRPRHASSPFQVPEVMPMPRTVEEILAQADELAKRFEDFEPEAGAAIDGAPLRAVGEAFEDLALAQKRLAERVSVARAMGHSWAVIGSMVGTSGEAVRQRYGPKVAPVKSAPAKAAPAKKAAKGTAKAAPAKVASSVMRSTTTGKVSKKSAASGRFVARNRRSSG